MENKIKKLIQLLDLIEQAIIKVISIIGWIYILMKVIRGGQLPLLLANIIFEFHLVINHERYNFKDRCYSRFDFFLDRIN